MRKNANDYWYFCWRNISWVITHFYYNLSNKKQDIQNKELAKKLSNEVIEVLHDYNKANLSIRELNKLLESKIYDEDNW